MSFVYPFFIERCVFLRIKSYYDDIYYTYTLFFIPFAFGALYRGTALHCCNCIGTRCLEESCVLQGDVLNASLKSIAAVLHVTASFLPGINIENHGKYTPREV